MADFHHAPSTKKGRIQRGVVGPGSTKETIRDSGRRKESYAHATAGTAKPILGVF